MPDRSVKVSIIYDNELYLQSLKADWGFSCLIEGHHIPTILFDTGADGVILLSNMNVMGIDPHDIDMIFLSHHHFDHIGGLSHFLNMNRDLDVYVPISLRGIKGVRSLSRIEESQPIGDYLYSTGELNGIEQSLIVESDRGLVVITGCSHPDMADILTSANRYGSIYGIIGGFHGFKKFELFKELGLICPVHCTRHTSEIRSLYPQTYVEGGAGKVITVS